MQVSINYFGAETMSLANYCRRCGLVASDLLCFVTVYNGMNPCLGGFGEEKGWLLLPPQFGSEVFRRGVEYHAGELRLFIFFCSQPW